MSQPSQETQALLAALRQAVAKTIDRKLRLGHYAVVCKDGRPAFLGNGPRVSAEDGNALGARHGSAATSANS